MPAQNHRSNGASLGLLVVIFAALLGLSSITLQTAPPSVTGAPLAQATATPTLPPLRVYSAEWAVQSLPEAGVNCVLDRASLSGRVFACVPGTPVP